MKNSRYYYSFLLLLSLFLSILSQEMEQSILRDIRIKGEFPLFEKNILNALTIMSGDSVNTENLESQKQNIALYLRREGFLNSNIEIEKTINKDEGYIDILFRITKSQRLKMDEIKFIGNERFSNFKLSFRYNIWDYFLFPTGIGRGYYESDLNKNLKELLAFYRNSGFPECQISQDVEIDTVNLKSSIKILIDEGPQYEWDYSSIDPFRKEEIRNAFDFSKRGNFRDVALNRGLHSLEHKLSDWGYENATISINDTFTVKNGRPVRILTPEIKTYPRIEIKDISILGVSSVKLNELEKKMWLSDKRENRKGKGIYTPTLLEDDINAIEDFYRAEGFYKISTEASVEIDEDSLSCDVIIKIDEGPPAIINKIEMHGFDKKELNGDPNGNVKEGDKFKEKRVNDLVKRYASAVSEIGFPDVSVLCDIRFNDDSSLVDIIIDISKGNYKSIGNIDFSGNFRTKKNYLLKEAGLKSGGPYIASEVSKAMSEIRNTALFERVYYKTSEDKNNEEIRNLKIFLSEKEALKLNGAFGYETENGAYLKFNASNNNIFGYNKSLTLGGILSPEERYLGLRYVEPDFFIRNSSLWINLYFKTDEMIDRTVVSRKVGNSYGVAVKFLKRSETSLGLSYEMRKIASYDNSISYPDTFNVSLINNARHVLSLKPKLILDARDSFIRPHKGAYSLLQANLSNGLNSSNSDDYFKMVLDLRAYVPLLKKIVFALRARGEGITPYGSSDSVAVDQLLTIGGNSSVRGYEKDKLYILPNGDAMAGFITLNSNIEMRVEIANFFEAMIFLDGGSLSPKAEFKSLQKPRFAFGPGLSILTPIGPIGLAYGFKIKKESDEEAGELHFSIGYIF